MKKQFNNLAARYIALFAVCSFISLSSMSSSSNATNATKVHEEAIEAARELLNIGIEAGVKEPGAFCRSWELHNIGLHIIQDYTLIHLDKPYKIYASQAQKILFDVDISTLDPWAVLCGYGFPVIYDNTYIGTIKVLRLWNEKMVESVNDVDSSMNAKLGSYMVWGREVAHVFHDERIQEERKIYPESKGYEIAVLNINIGGGRYIIRLHQGKVEAIAPRFELEAEILSVTKNNDGNYPFISCDSAAIFIKKQVEKLSKGSDFSKQESNNNK